MRTRQKIFDTLISALVLSLVLGAAVTAAEIVCDSLPGNVRNVKIDYGSSAVYSRADMDAAANVIKEEFKDFRGCELHRISYTSDDRCSDDAVRELNETASARAKKENEGRAFTQAIVFRSSFHSPKYGGDGTMNRDFEYDCWEWTLGRTGGGQWVLVRYGHP